MAGRPVRTRPGALDPRAATRRTPARPARQGLRVRHMPRARTSPRGRLGKGDILRAGDILPGFSRRGIFSRAGDIPLYLLRYGKRWPFSIFWKIPPPENVPFPRPLWLLAEPQPLEGEEQPRYQGALELEEGPERIESGWWDGRDVRRDYYVARTPAGVRVWIFRERRTPGAGSCTACSAESAREQDPAHELRRAALPHQLQLPARRLARRGTHRACRRAQLFGTGHHRRVLCRRASCAPISRPSERGLKLIVGSEFRLEDGLHCVLLATDRRGYGRLCRLITRARRAAPKGQYRLGRRDFS